MKVSTIIAQRRVQAAIDRKTVPAADRVYQIGAEVLVFSEQERNLIRPFVVMLAYGRMITMHNKEGTYPQIFNVFKLKLYYCEHSPIIHYRISIFSSPLAPNITEKIKPSYPRASKFATANRNEIPGLINSGTWKIVTKDEVPDNAKI